MRQLIKEISSNRVTHYFPEGGATLTSAGLIGPGVNAPNMPLSDYELVDDVDACPGDFLGLHYTHNGSWSVVDQTALDAALAPILDAARKAKASAIHALAKSKRNGGIVVSGMTVSTDGDARSLLQGGLGKTSVKFTTSTGDRAELNEAQFQAVYDAVDAHIQAWFGWEYDKMEEIDSASTLAGIEAIDINADHPA